MKYKNISSYSYINPLDVRLIVIDNFCGAGGVTYGESLSLAVDKLLNVA